MGRQDRVMERWAQIPGERVAAYRAAVEIAAGNDEDEVAQRRLQETWQALTDAERDALVAAARSEGYQIRSYKK